MNSIFACQYYVYLQGRPLSFADRPYLPPIYVADGNLVLRCSRQTEKTTFLVNRILYEACRRPGIRMLYVAPRLEQVQVFRRSRLGSMLDDSPLIRRVLLGAQGMRQQVMNMRFRNGSDLFLRAAFHSGDSCSRLT